MTLSELKELIDDEILEAKDLMDEAENCIEAAGMNANAEDVEQYTYNEGYIDALNTVLNLLKKVGA